MNCDFCSIAKGDYQDAEIVASGETWLAFFPLEPATPGHTLVIPRLHIPDLWSLEPSLAADLINAVVSVGRAIHSAVQPQGMNLITSSGRAAEQTIFHLHLHLVPRWTHDGFGRIWPPEQPHMEQWKKDELADTIRAVWVKADRS